MKVMDMFEDSLLMSNNLVLPFEKNFITFFFTSLCFNNAENCTFEYMLEGLDEMWRSNSTVNYVAYNKLPFGQYTFKVRAYNSDGIVDSNVASYSFTIRAPFYLRWWFIALLVLVAAAMLAAVLRFRQIQKLKLEKVRNKIARDLHDDIGSALGSISFFSETAKRRLVNKDEKSTMQVLEKMGSTSREMIENMHDIVWAVNPDNDSFSHVIERMKSFATDLAAANNMRMDFHCDMELNTFKLSMTERKNLFLIFKEALYNSCKYSGCDMLTVKLLKTKTAKVMMTLQDNGHGFEVSRRMGKGNGLKNMQVRADEIKARIAISSSDNGTLINITL